MEWKDLQVIIFYNRNNIDIIYYITIYIFIFVLAIESHLIPHITKEKNLCLKA